MQTLNIVITLFLILSLSHAHDACKPTQIHLALSDVFTSNPASDSPIKLIFHTQDKCDTSYVTLDTPKGNLTVQATAINYFSAEYSNTEYDTFVHIFDFPSLDYEQVYQYTCYPDTTGENPSQGPFTFYVPSPEPNGNPVSLILFGDLSATTDGQDTMDQLSSIKDANFSKIATYVHMGDIAYDLEGTGGQKGDDFMNAIQDFAASIPYMISPGNHEVLSNFSNVNMRFKMPYFTQTQNHYYSYNLGNVHFATIDLDFVIQYPDLLPYMVAWLDNDLNEANNNRAQRPWLVLYTHRPLYCSKDTDDCQNNAKTYYQIEDVLNKYKVDLYLSGHIHAYERMLPIYQGDVAKFEHVNGDDNYHYIVNPQAPVYVVQGMAGHSGDHDDKKVYKGKNFTVTVDTEYSLIMLQVLNNTHLYLENIHSKDGKVTDFFYIIKDTPGDNHWSLLEKWESMMAYMRQFGH